LFIRDAKQCEALLGQQELFLSKEENGVSVSYLFVNLLVCLSVCLFVYCSHDSLFLFICFKCFFYQATVEAVQELIKKHEEFSKRMDAQDEKINQMIQFAQRLANEGHYAQDKITEKAQSLHERYLYTKFGSLHFHL